MIEYLQGKYIFGTASVSEKGQIVIPKSARDKFNIKPGDMLLIIGDEKKGLAIVPSNNVMELMNMIANFAEPAEREKLKRLSADEAGSHGKKAKKKR